MGSGTFELVSLQRTLYECIIRWPGRWSPRAIDAARIESSRGERTAGEWFLYLQELDGAVPSFERALRVVRPQKQRSRPDPPRLRLVR